MVIIYFVSIQLQLVKYKHRIKLFFYTQAVTILHLELQHGYSIFFNVQPPYPPKKCPQPKTTTTIPFNLPTKTQTTVFSRWASFITTQAASQPLVQVQWRCYTTPNYLFFCSYQHVNLAALTIIGWLLIIIFSHLKENGFTN